MKYLIVLCVALFAIGSLYVWLNRQNSIARNDCELKFQAMEQEVVACQAKLAEAREKVEIYRGAFEQVSGMCPTK